MGLLVDGKWTKRWYSSDAHGRFVREGTLFHGRAVPEAGRYHLYASFACPWASRALIMRKLKGLESAITVGIVDPFMGEDGWAFSDALRDEVNGSAFLRDVYVRAKPDYSGRVTVPVLWDRREGTIVNNESREIIRMFDHDFAVLSPGAPDYAPPDLVQAIDREIDAMYDPVNNGVYRAGFATKQRAYEEAVGELFAALDRYEERLSRQRYLLGARMTEADVCLFTTLVRFDPVYHFHFKCNLRRLRDYPNLWGYVRDVYQHPGVAETVNLDHIKQHYFRSHESVNPTRIVPVGPEIDYSTAHDRARFQN
ncbi:MAG TPA: glutathione S-transferase family protein [Polyangiaceae bacterium]|nr:glutathione S-transferase family protein [Polyangiaceae bacterium]